MDLNKLKGIIPDDIILQIPSVIEKFAIKTPLRMAHFLAQCATESGNFTRFVENLNYDAKGLMKTFEKHFPTLESTVGYAHNPEKIANKVYANSDGNGDEASGDGYKYCGRGAIQLTKKNNYHLFDDFVEDNIIESPTLVKTKYPLLSAAWFFSKNGLNAIADTGDTDLVVTKISKGVNLGNPNSTHTPNGLADRLSYFHKFYPLIK